MIESHIKFRFIIQFVTIIHASFSFAQNGILNVGFDIDDTVLFSRDVFLLSLIHI